MRLYIRKKNITIIAMKKDMCPFYYYFKYNEMQATFLLFLLLNHKIKAIFRHKMHVSAAVHDACALAA